MTEALEFNPFAVAAANLDDDPALDLVAVGSVPGSDFAKVLWNDGSGSFGSVTTLTVRTNPNGVAAADFDRDGTVDLVIGHFFEDRISLYLNRGNRTFRPRRSVRAGGPADPVPDQRPR